MLDFRMQTFLTVCRCMNFTRASEELNITQPAVSQHIRFLEKHYKAKLFCYEGRRLKLTDAGKILKDASLTMMHDEVSLKSRILRSDEKNVRDMHFGVTKTVGDVVMPGVLRRYMYAHPDVQIHMETAPTGELLARLGSGAIDFVLTEGSFKKSDYDFLEYSTERFIAVASPGYSFVQQPRRLENLCSERLLLPESGSSEREMLEQILKARGLEIGELSNRSEIDSLPAVRTLVKAGCGIAFFYESAVREELQKGELLELCLQDFQASHELAFIWRRGSIYADTYREIFQQFSAVS